MVSEGLQVGRKMQTQARCFGETSFDKAREDGFSTLQSLQIPVFAHDTCSTSLPLDFDGWRESPCEFEVVAVQILLLWVTALMFSSASWLGILHLGRIRSSGIGIHADVRC